MSISLEFSISHQCSFVADKCSFTSCFVPFFLKRVTNFFTCKSFFFFKDLSISIFGCAGSLWLHVAFSSWGELGCALLQGMGLLTAMAFLVAECGLLV